MAGLKEGDRVSGVTKGAMTEYVRVTSALLGANVFKLPPQVSYEEAATLEALSTRLHAVGLACPATGETVVALGAGIIGLGVLQCLKALTPTKTIVVDMSEERLAMAKQTGPTSSSMRAWKTPIRRRWS